MPAACGSVVGRQSSCVWEESSRGRPVHQVWLFADPGVQAMQREWCFAGVEEARGRGRMMRMDGGHGGLSHTGDDAMGGYGVEVQR